MRFVESVHNVLSQIAASPEEYVETYLINQLRDIQFNIILAYYLLIYQLWNQFNVHINKN